jgi:hypothetical protein
MGVRWILTWTIIISVNQSIGAGVPAEKSECSEQFGVLGRVAVISPACWAFLRMFCPSRVAFGASLFSEENSLILQNNSLITF